MRDDHCNDSVDESPGAAGGDGSESARQCRKCGQLAVADEQVCKACHAFLPGNQIQLTHGGRRRTLASPRESELWHAWASDLGGEEELTAGQAATLARVVEAHTIARTAYGFLESTRETVVSDRVQKAVQTLATAANTFYRGAQLLGLERRQKRAGIREWIEAENREQEEGST